MRGKVLRCAPNTHSRGLTPSPARFFVFPTIAKGTLVGRFFAYRAQCVVRDGKGLRLRRKILRCARIRTAAAYAAPARTSAFPTKNKSTAYAVLLFLVGTVRLELMTSCMSSMRSNQLSYAPARLITISFSGTFVNKKTHAFKIFRAVCAGGVKTGRQKRTGGAGRALFFAAGARKAEERDRYAMGA